MDHRGWPQTHLSVDWGSRPLRPVRYLLLVPRHPYTRAEAMTFVDRFGYALGGVERDVHDSAAAGHTRNSATAFVGAP